MGNRSSYRITATRSGDWWSLASPDVPGAFSQCRRLSQAEDVMRDAIAGVLDVAEDSFTVERDVRLEGSAAERLVQALELGDAADDATDQAFRARADAARRLVDECSLSYRDVADLLGISHQRVSQILAAPTKAAESTEEGSSRRRWAVRSGAPGAA